MPNPTPTGRTHLLSLESSGTSLSVALAPLTGVGPAATLLSTSKEPTSTRLLATVDFLLRDLGLDATALGAVAVNVGPGSFTGLRIGCMVAKSLAHDRALPLVAVPGLLARVVSYLGTLPAPGWPAVVMTDARRQQVFGAVYALPEEDDDGEGDHETAALGEALFRLASGGPGSGPGGGEAEPGEGHHHAHGHAHDHGHHHPHAHPAPWNVLVPPVLDTAERFLRRAIDTLGGAPAILCCPRQLLKGAGGNDPGRLIPPGWEFAEESPAPGTADETGGEPPFTAAHVATVARAMLAAGLTADAATLEPEYIREPDAKLPRVPQPE